ncbi:unnamed protein product [Lactuca virosa]|uniref:Uncharacterized protein n=1 Tax=Lactuca virosa TaxID=75947 RepID=A0AAU9P1D1_9ASTR|nr:unnamed protein product [Lactuca virosa]
MHVRWMGKKYSHLLVELIILTFSESSLNVYSWGWGRFWKTRPCNNATSTTSNNLTTDLNTTSSYPASLTTNTSTPSTAVKKDRAEYLPLYRAIKRNDWEKAQEIFNQDTDALTAKLNKYGYTVLHIAINNAENIQFVENLLKEIRPESLPTLVTNNQKFNPLHRAAVVDNTKAARMLVEKNPRLLFILSGEDLLPIHIAILNSHRTTFLYLFDVCKQHIELSQQDGSHSPFEGVNGALILNSAISSGFLDVSYELIMKYPDMARTKSKTMFPLTCIANKSDSYYSGMRYNFYQRFVYSYVPTKDNRLHDANKIQDIENQDTYNAKCRKSYFSEDD